MKVVNIVIIVSFISLLVSFWNRNDLPRNVAFLPELMEDPRQTKTRAKPFEAKYKGVTYEIEPQYEYDLHGMVVSFRHHDGNSRMHFLSNDHLNMLDVCVDFVGRDVRSAEPRADELAVAPRPKN